MAHGMKCREFDATASDLVVLISCSGTKEPLTCENVGSRYHDIGFG